MEGAQLEGQYPARLRCVRAIPRREVQGKEEPALAGRRRFRAASRIGRRAALPGVRGRHPRGRSVPALDRALELRAPGRNLHRPGALPRRDGAERRLPVRERLSIRAARVRRPAAPARVPAGEQLRARAPRERPAAVPERVVVDHAVRRQWNPLEQRVPVALRVVACDVPDGVRRRRPRGLVVGGRDAVARHFRSRALARALRGASLVPAGARAGGRKGVAQGTAARRFSLDLSRVRGAITARWYDPATGGWAPLDHPPARSAAAQFETPGANAAGTNDWVLVVEAPGPAPTDAGRRTGPVREASPP